jgi:hypothetical protein
VATESSAIELRLVRDETVTFAVNAPVEMPVDPSSLRLFSIEQVCIMMNRQPVAKPDLLAR